MWKRGSYSTSSFVVSLVVIRVGLTLLITFSLLGDVHWSMCEFSPWVLPMKCPFSHNVRANWCILNISASFTLGTIVLFYQQLECWLLFVLLNVCFYDWWEMSSSTLLSLYEWVGGEGCSESGLYTPWISINTDPGSVFPIKLTEASVLCKHTRLFHQMQILAQHKMSAWSQTLLPENCLKMWHLFVY